MKDNKKTAAAVSAVQQYIRTEAETMARQAGVAAPPAPAKIWGLSGRQAQMQIRHLMNMKAFHGLKFR